MQKYFESFLDFQKNSSPGDFWVAVDSNPKRLEDEELWVDVYIRPIMPVKFIECKMTITPNISFEDFMNQEEQDLQANVGRMPYPVSMTESEPSQGEMDFDDLPPVEPKKFTKINLFKKRKKKEKVPFKDLQDIIESQR